MAPYPQIERPWSRSTRPIPTRFVRPAKQFLHAEVASGIILLGATLLALAWANLDPSGYTSFWSTALTVELGGWGHTEDLRHVVNDGLMVLFFFVIGLEVKRELVVGELADRRAATLPLLAALGGMVVPAAVFLAITVGDPEAVRGWGVPMATDIAFALGVLALLGSRVPVTLKVLLLGIAVIDDIGAIIVIALFYSGEIRFDWLLGAIGALIAMRLLAAVHVRSRTPYVVLGLAAWLATFESGIHATIAGVAIGLLTPAHPFQRGDAVSVAAHEIAESTVDDEEDPDKDASEWQTLASLSREAVSPLWQLEHALHPWTASVVLPLFALANVGIVLDGSTAASAFDDVLGWGIAAGLVIGKPVGIVLGALLAVRLGLSALPLGVTWRHVLGIGFLAGIGFTMSLFVTTLAFTEEPLVEASTFAVLVASVLAGAIGAALLLTTKPATGDELDARPAAVVEPGP